MTAAFAPAFLSGADLPENPKGPTLLGAQTLLTLKRARQSYLAETAAVAVYALVLFGALSYTTNPQQAPPEEPMELVMEPAPPPAVEQPKPPEREAVKPPEPQVEEPPPPPAAVEPPVAPVKPPPLKPVIKPKPVVKPVPKVAASQQQAARASAAPTVAARSAPVPAGATPSAIANQIHLRLMRAAANAYPESQKPRSAHINYRVLIDASGHVTSFTITPSGNAAFDAAASRLGGRIGTVDAPGHAAALSGSFTFAYQ